MTLKYDVSLPASPYVFFLSYARANAESDPKGHLDRFFNDLSKAVHERFTDAPPLTGYRDIYRLRIGDQWKDEISKVLSTCGVMVCLLSPEFIKSQCFCGKELAAFRHRMSITGCDSYPVILPVAWTPFDSFSKNLPTFLIDKHIQPHSGRYDQRGLLSIMDDENAATTYKSFLDDLADRIQEVARSYQLPPLQPALRVGEFPSVFLEITNPFQTAGALANGSPSYISRPCDSELQAALKIHPLIAVHGEPGIGKTSLLNRISSLLESEPIICFIDFHGTRVDDPKIFHNRFFHLTSCQFGSTVDWDDLNSAIISPSIIVIDEFGSMSQEIAVQFIPRLYTLALAKSYLRIVVALPREIASFISTLGLENPKYKRGWQQISIRRLESHHIRKLIDLLPYVSKSLAEEHFNTIRENSGGAPSALQRLFSELFDAEQSGAKRQKLEAIIKDRASYT